VSPTRLLIATTNPGKLREIQPLLSGLDYDFLTLRDCAPADAPDETGRTFAANARLKALYYANATGLLTVAEDSGLEIDALDGAPGVASARFGGAELSYPEKFGLIYAALAERGRVASPARFVCALALAHPGQVLFEAQGTVDGHIAPRPVGRGGFGYDPIFYYPPLERTLAEASEEKALVSHRAAAFTKLRPFLERLQATAAP
jgi:XTP/dITP diphosphohydrolase